MALTDYSITRNIAAGTGIAPFDEREGPVYRKNPWKLGAEARYKRWSDTAALADTLGRQGAAAQARKKLANLLRKNPDADFSGVEAQDFSDWRNLGPGGPANEAMAGLRRLRHKRSWEMDQATGQGGRSMNRFGTVLNKEMEAAMRRGETEEIDTTLRDAQERANERMATPAVGAGDEQAIRSRAAAMVQQQASSRLARVGAMLGLGNVSQSPAAQALAADVAADADRTLVSTLRDTSLAVSGINREQGRADMAMAGNVASMRHGLLSGATSLIQSRSDAAGIMDALYARDASLDLQRRAMKESGAQDGGNAALGSGIGAAVGLGLGILLAPVTGGASLAGYAAMMGAGAAAGGGIGSRM
jgi:hypothetical protein